MGLAEQAVSPAAHPLCPQWTDRVDFESHTVQAVISG